MVIPIPAGLVPPLAGPPPDELRDKFQVIKMCTLALFFCAISRLVSAFLFSTLSEGHGHGGGATLAASPSFSLFLNVLIGAFLQSDDPTFKPIYEFFTNTCLKPCHEQGMCQGGLTCLMSFTIFNAVSVVFDLLLPPSITQLVPLYLAVATNSSGMAALGSGLAVFSMVGALLAEAVAAVYGYLCIQATRAGGVTAQGGDWGQEMTRPGGGAPGWGGGPLGGGGGGFLGSAQGRYSGVAGGYGNDEESPAPERTRVGGTGQNFQVFQGSGQRLGDN